MVHGIQALTFDVTHTLIHCPRLGEIYSEVLGPARRRGRSRTRPDGSSGRSGRSWPAWPIPAATASPPTPRVRRGGGSGSWSGSASTWRRRPRRASPPPSCSPASAGPRPGRSTPTCRTPSPPCAAGGSGWAVVSNWDTRLPELLERARPCPPFRGRGLLLGRGGGEAGPAHLPEALRRLPGRAGRGAARRRRPPGGRGGGAGGRHARAPSSARAAGPARETCATSLPCRASWRACLC